MQAATKWNARTTLAGYDRRLLRADLIAGLTTAVMLVPQSLGYATLAGVPPVVGLYAALVPPVLYAVFGGSRTLSVGPVAMDSLLVAVTVSTLAQSGSAQYLPLAALLALTVGAIQLALGVLGMGFVANFLSRPVLSGFTSAAALIIGASQLTHLVQIRLPQTHHVHRVVWDALLRTSQWHWVALALGVGNLVGLTWLKRRAPRAPRALIAVVVSTVLVIMLSLADYGVAIVGVVPRGLPSPRLPTFDWSAIKTMLPGAATIALLSFVEAFSSGKTLARQDGSRIDPNVELRALGFANAVGSVFGGFAVAGGLSRSVVNAQAGARTKLAGVFTAAFVMLTLMFLTPLFFHMPKAVLAAIIISAVAGLFDVTEPARLWRIKRTDFYLLGLTFAGTLSLGIQWGVLCGVAMSLGLFLVRTTRPHIAVLGRIPGSEAYLNVARHPHAERTPGVLVVRLDAQFYFGNVSFLKDTLEKLAAQERVPLRAVVIDASGMNELDSSAEAALHEIDDDYRSQGIQLLFAHVKGPVRDVMYRSGLLARLSNSQRIYLRTHDAVLVASGHILPSSERSSAEDTRHPADRIGCAGLPPDRQG